MRRMPWLAGCLALCMATSSARAEDEEKTYRNDYSDQDLTGKKFVNEDLSDSNFESADLTNADLSGARLTGCNFQGAVLSNTRWVEADFTGSDFRNATISYVLSSRSIMNKVDFSGLDLSKVQMGNLKARESNFRNVKGMGEVYNADFFGSDFRGANLQAALGFDSAKWRKAKYDSRTRWPKGFDPKAAGAILVEDEEDAANEETKPQPKKTSKKTTPKKGMDSEEDFTALDINEDGVLSGKESKPYADRDTNEDGDITLDEFLQEQE